MKALQIYAPIRDRHPGVRAAWKNGKMEPIGIYIAVPFCRAKCTFCNFASDSFGAGRMAAYVDRLCAEIAGMDQRAAQLGAKLPRQADTIYLGGGTPSLLPAQELRRIFESVHRMFHVEHSAEVTLECAPGQLAEETLREMLQQGLNRVSLGVQSFVDAEAAAVGRLHTRTMCLEEIVRLRGAGIVDVGIDLIAGLPGQTEASWRYSVAEAIACGATHISVYMLEVDGESRLGREALAGGTRYGAATLPPEEAVAEWYGLACTMLEDAGVKQYEISNFARPGFRSRHNVKYWRRGLYAGFGLDAHSMMRAGGGALRFQNGDELDGYMGDGLLPRLAPVAEVIGEEAAFEETLFLGLRMVEGVSLSRLRGDFGAELVAGLPEVLEEVRGAGLVCVEGDRVCLTAAGRLASNEVFERLLVVA